MSTYRSKCLGKRLDLSRLYKVTTLNLINFGREDGIVHDLIASSPLAKNGVDSSQGIGCL